MGFGQSLQREGEDTEAIKRLFTPEFRNRLDAVITFRGLTPKIIRSVVDKFVKELGAQLADKRVSIELDDEAAAWLAEKGYDPLYGARPLARVIQDQIKRPLADELLFGKLAKGGKVYVTIVRRQAGLPHRSRRRHAAADRRRTRARTRIPARIRCWSRWGSGSRTTGEPMARARGHRRSSTRRPTRSATSRPTRRRGKCAVIDSVLDYEPTSGRTDRHSADRLIAFVREHGLTYGVGARDARPRGPPLRRALRQGTARRAARRSAQGITVVQDVFGKIFNAGTEFQRDGSQFDHLFADGERFTLGIDRRPRRCIRPGTRRPA